MPNALSLNLKTHALDFENEAEAQLMGALLLPYILEPDLPSIDEEQNKKARKRLERQRRRIRLVFLGRERSRLKKDGMLTQLSDTIRKSLKAEFKAKSGALAYAGKPKDYLPSIAPDHKPKQSDPLRQIFTTGLIVLILEYIHAVEKDVPQIGMAQERLYRNYKTNTLWIVNSQGTPKAWGRNMPVAHLAAAWLRLLIDKKCLRNPRKAFPTLQKNLPTFLAYANHYEQFLTVEKVTGHKMRDYQERDPNKIVLRPLLKPNQLWTLGDMAPDSKVSPIAALPTKGLRKKSSSKKVD